MKNLTLVIIIILLQVHSFASESCQSLFENNGHSIDQIIKELYSLRIAALVTSGRHADVAKNLFKSKFLELEKFIPRSEIEKRLKDVKIDSKIADSEQLVNSEKSPKSDKDIIKDFLLENGITMDGKEHNSPFIIALTQKRFDVAKALISLGSRVEDDIGFGRTPLLWLAYEGNKEAVEFLLSVGANIDARDTNGFSALHFAATGNHTDIARMLLDLKVPVDIFASKGSTPLFSAARGGHPDMTQLLIERGANVNALDSEGNSAVFHTPSPIVAKLLIDNGIDINHQNKYQQTPLNEAIVYVHPKTAETLIKAKADLEIKDSEGRTALMTALYRNNPHIAKILIDSGANVNVDDNEGKTPLVMAREKVPQLVDDLKKAGARR
jgi:ankyrin repeat protein